MSGQNICKFVSGITSEVIVTTNFILEQRSPDQGQLIRPTHVMYLVISGDGVLHTELFSRKLQAGSLFFSFAGSPYRIENRSNLNFMYISFEGKRGDELFHRFGISKTNCIFNGLESLIPIWKDSLARANGQNIDLLSESMLLYGFSKLEKFQDPKDRPLDAVLQYLDRSFTDSSISLTTAAEIVGYNPKYLSHAFKQELGVGFSDYLKNIRLKHAMVLMEQGVISVKNIALLSGFADPLYFSKVFKNATGIAPKDFIRRQSRA